MRDDNASLREILITVDPGVIEPEGLGESRELRCCRRRRQDGRQLPGTLSPPIEGESQLLRSRDEQDRQLERTLPRRDIETLLHQRQAVLQTFVAARTQVS